MSMWKKKKKQQIVFDRVVTKSSNHAPRLNGFTRKDDGHIFVQKVTNYSKKVRNGGVIIDVGCGTGTLLKEISINALNSHHLIGIDISSESLKIAKQNNKAVDFVVCDIEALPLRDNISDMVIIWNVLHHLPTLKPLNNLIQLLNSKGFMLIDDKINGNPLQEILTLAYPLLPYSFRMVLREKGHHIDQHGHLPSTKRYGPKTFVKIVKQCSDKLRIVEIRYHGFFFLLGVVEFLFYFFPRLSNIQIPIYKLYSLERREILRWSAISMTMVIERV